MALASYGGVDIFGPLVSIDHNPNASAAQISAFFGVTGTLCQFGGGRGRAFMVEGVAVVANVGALRTFEAAFLSYADGTARTLVDPYGATWQNVIFKGDFRFQGKLGFAPGGVVTKSYKAVFVGLT